MPLKTKSSWQTDADFLRAHAKQQRRELTEADFKRNEVLKIEKERWMEGNGNWNTGLVLTFKGRLGINGDIGEAGGNAVTQKMVKKFWNILDRHRYGKSGVKNGRRYKRIGGFERGKSGTNRHWNFMIDTDGEDVGLFNLRATSVWENRLRMGQCFIIKKVGTAEQGIDWGIYGTKEITIFNSDTLDLETTHL